MNDNEILQSHRVYITRKITYENTVYMKREKHILTIISPYAGH